MKDFTRYKQLKKHVPRNKLSDWPSAPSLLLFDEDLTCKRKVKDLRTVVFKRDDCIVSTIMAKPRVRSGPAFH
jgi:hypothetical protein